MDIIKIISIALCVLIISSILKKVSGEYATLAVCFTGAAICLISFMFLSPVIEFIKDMCKSESLYNIFTLMFKSSGVCLMTSLASEMCRDMGEAGLSSKIEFAGKCTLIAFCLPLIKQVFEYAKTFIY